MLQDPLKITIGEDGKAKLIYRDGVVAALFEIATIEVGESTS
jgi:hypothetical protein